MAKPTAQNSDKKDSFSTGQASVNAPEILLASNRQLQRRIFDFYTIIELSRNLNSVLNLKSLLSSFLNVLMSQIKVKKAAVFQKASRKQKNYVLTSWMADEQYSQRSVLAEKAEIVRQLSMKMMAMTTEELILEVTDIYEKSYLNYFNPGLVIPLNTGRGMNGFLFVGPKNDRSVFTNEDKEFLSLLSGQMAVALENALLHEAEKKAIAELQATQEQLVHTERLAALGEMSAKIAHEINNPLGIIKNYLTLIDKAKQDPAKSAQYVDIVGQEIDRIAGIVRELLQFHRPQQLDYKVINALNVLEDVISFLSPQFVQTKIKCTRQFSPDSPQVEASADNLKQVFINVLLNSVDAMPEGGSILISTRLYEGNLLIRIQDSGPGVPEALLPRIFEPFFTTKPDGKGTGLGLAVCYGIIKKHNGNIKFSNTEKGGCMEIRIPAANTGHG